MSQHELETDRRLTQEQNNVSWMKTPKYVHPALKSPEMDNDEQSLHHGQISDGQSRSFQGWFHCFLFDWFRGSYRKKTDRLARTDDQAAAIKIDSGSEKAIFRGGRVQSEAVVISSHGSDSNES
jgi:hypothetical protein